MSTLDQKVCLKCGKPFHREVKHDMIYLDGACDACKPKLTSYFWNEIVETYAIVEPGNEKDNSEDNKKN